MADYRHTFADDKRFDYPLGKIVCVGRNYADHAKELNNPVPEQPLLFIKPATAAVSMADGFAVPVDKGPCHYELEMSVLIGKPLTAASRDQVIEAVAGIGLGFDLTLRALQDQLKQQGHPWERAKAFDGSCPLSAFVTIEAAIEKNKTAEDTIDLQDITLQLQRNGSLQQSGHTKDMLFPVVDLIAEISESFSLLPGDVVLTGTPAGVGPLTRGDKLLARLGDYLCVESRVL